MLRVEGNYFVFECSRERRSLARKAGFKWHGDFNCYATASPLVAAKLRAHADEQAQEKIRTAFIETAPWLGRIPYPKGLTPRPFQLSAANFALSKNRSYLALDPGLGKTIIAALVMNALGRHPIVCIVPPSLAVNTKYEFLKWCTWKPVIYIYGLDDVALFTGRAPDVLLVPDSLISRKVGHDLRMRVEDAGALGGATMIIDEAHRFKNESAKRTVALLSDNGFHRHFDRHILMSGTPLENDRPMELYPVLSRFAGETIDFMSRKAFGMRYCAGFFDGYAYDFTGASHVKELAEKVRGTFMLRLKKKDVLRDLPPKTEEIVFLAENLPAKIAAFEKKYLAVESPEDLMAHLAPNGHTSTYRHRLGLAKAPLAVAYIKELLEDNPRESILVFAAHVEVIARLEKGLAKYRPIVITGAVDKNKRQALVNLFQSDKKRRLFMGNAKACGVGFTLTKATRVIHVEPDWVTGVNDQAADRAHRYGQKQSVLVQYLAFRNSLDRAVLEVNLRKRKTIQLL